MKLKIVPNLTTVAGIDCNVCLNLNVIVVLILFYVCISQAAWQPCCKGDQPFQWETPKFDPSYFLNPLIFFSPKFAQMIMSSISPDVQNLVKIHLRGASPRIGEI